MACDNEPAYLMVEMARLLEGTLVSAFLLKMVFLLTAPEEKQDLISKQRLFSVYTHPGLHYTFPETSMFYGTEIEDRVDTSHAWGSFDLVSAEIKLLRAALENERNQ